MQQIRIPNSLVRKTSVNAGGGGKSFPRSDHQTHGQTLLTATDSLKQQIYLKEDSSLVDQMVFSVITIPDTTVKQQRLALEHIGISLVSIDSKDGSKGVVASKKGIFDKLMERISIYASSDDHRGKSYFSAIDSFEEIDPISKIDPILLDGDRKSCIIFLYSNLTPEEQNRVLQVISFELAKIEETNTDFLLTSVSGRALTGSLLPTDVIRIATEYNSVRSIKFNSTLSFERSMLGSPVSSAVLVLPSISDVKVAVIDSGIAAGSRIISPSVTGRFSKIPLTGILDTSHGTLVASRVILGIA